MTPAQLEHLKLIDALLANLLSTAEKRTPGEWQAATETVWTRHERICENAETDDCAFIASCAGNAEAGWRATRAVIKRFHDSAICREWHGYMQTAVEPLLAAFPLELVQKP